MDVTLQLNKVNKKATIVFANRSDFGFLTGWRKDLGEEQNTRMRDAVDFAQLAVYRFEAHSAVQPYAKRRVDIADHIKSNPSNEIASLVLMKCDWFPPSPILGICHFRRTWSNNIILDYLAAYPFIARSPDGYPHRVRGVGLAFLHFVAQIANELKCESIWGEATPHSWEYYQKEFDLSPVKDLIFVPRTNFISYLDRPEIKEIPWNPAVQQASPAFAKAYEMEEKSSPFVGNKTAVFNPARRLAYRFLDLPDHVQTNIARELGLMQSNDEAQPQAEQFNRFFQRATASGKLASLWQKVEGKYPDGEPDANPFPSQ